MCTNILYVSSFSSFSIFVHVLGCGYGSPERCYIVSRLLGRSLWLRVTSQGSPHVCTCCLHALIEHPGGVFSAVVGGASTRGTVTLTRVHTCG
ncbi:hypothetical protein FKM82_017483 [Ascaphus truei]